MTFHPTSREAIQQRDEAEENHAQLKRTTDDWAEKLGKLRELWEDFCLNHPHEIGWRGNLVERALQDLEKP